ncbi:MAG: RNA polymerase sigma-70 factor, partial [Bacteroidota bacterium]
MAHQRENESERQLLERLRDSDQEAFRLLFEKYQPVLFRFVLQSLHEADDAHDVVQETFVRVWDRRASVKPDLPLLALLFRVSRNLVRDRAKHREVRKRLEPDVPSSLHTSAEDPEETLYAGVLEERINEIVRTKLPVKCREVFLLSRMEGMSNAEISKRLGITVKTVENQITRGLNILRRELRGYVGGK